MVTAEEAVAPGEGPADRGGGGAAVQGTGVGAIGGGQPVQSQAAGALPRTVSGSVDMESPDLGRGVYWGLEAETRGGDLVFPRGCVA